MVFWQITKQKSAREARRNFFRVFRQNTKQKSAREARRDFLGHFLQNTKQIQKLQQNKKGGYSLNLKYGGHDDGYLNNIYIQTPKMFCPFGAISFGKTIKKYTINLSFENKSFNKKVK